MGFLAGVPPNVRWLVFLLTPLTVGVGYFGILVGAYLPEIGVPVNAIGLLLGTMGISMVVSAVPLGLLSDRVERKRILIPAGFVFPLILVVFAMTRDLAVLLIASAVAGIAEGAFLTTWNAIIADQTTPENRNAAFALSFIVFTLGSGLGLALPLAFPAVEGATGWDPHAVHVGALLILALASYISPAGLWFLLRGYRQVPHEREAGGPRGSLRPLLKFSGLNGLIGLGAGFIIPLIPTWMLLRFNVSDEQSGPLLAIAGLTMGLAAVSSARLAKRLGAMRAIAITQGTSTIFMLAMVATPTAWIAGGVYVLRAALMNMASPLMDAFLMGIIPREQRGLASAVNSLIWRLPNSITTVIGGAILASGNLELPFYLATAFYAAGIVGLYATFKSVRPRA